MHKHSPSLFDIQLRINTSLFFYISKVSFRLTSYHLKVKKGTDSHNSAYALITIVTSRLNVNYNRKEDND
jgi:hypothetical protein